MEFNPYSNTEVALHRQL